MRSLLLLVAAVLAWPDPGLADEGWTLQSHYTKHEARIPMRDGARLYTSIFIPKESGRRWPILLVRTPYGLRPYGVDNPLDRPPSPKLVRAGYIFVVQDVRGRNMSEGEFVNVRPMRPRGAGPRAVDESTDAHDTIEWLLRNLGDHNGRVGMLGISYPGFYATAALLGAHKALVAVSPQAPVTDWFLGDDFHQNGAFMLAPSFNFLSVFGVPRPKPTRKRAPSWEQEDPDAYSYFLKLGPLRNVDAREFKGRITFWKEMMAHGTYDAYWRSRSILPHLRAVRPAVLVVGGWFDAEDLWGTLRVFETVEKGSPANRPHQRLVMGPWYHGGWSRGPGDRLGAVRFGARTSDFYTDRVELPFFEHYLKGKQKLSLAKATVFETGTNQWRSYTTWPPREARAERLCLAAGGRLQPSPGGSGHGEYLSDPERPVPVVEQTTTDLPREYMVEDQRFAARRTDVLSYQTEPLEEDLTMAGPLRPSLHVSTSGTDSDFVVKLIDVYPDDYPDPNPNPRKLVMGGYQQLVRGAIMRGKFRNSIERPEPFVPWRPTRISFVMDDVNHTFRRGHRIMVQIQSSWFPLFDRNPQSFVDIYRAGPSDFRRATQRVHHSAALPSCLGYGRLPRRF